MIVTNKNFIPEEIKKTQKCLPSFNWQYFKFLTQEFNIEIHKITMFAAIFYEYETDLSH
jgi:hypothetical protein